MELRLDWSWFGRSDFFFFLKRNKLKIQPTYWYKFWWIEIRDPTISLNKKQTPMTQRVRPRAMFHPLHPPRGPPLFSRAGDSSTLFSSYYYFFRLYLTYIFKNFQFCYVSSLCLFYSKKIIFNIVHRKKKILHYCFL